MITLSEFIKANEKDISEALSGQWGADEIGETLVDVSVGKLSFRFYSGTDVVTPIEYAVGAQTAFVDSLLIGELESGTTVIKAISAETTLSEKLKLGILIARNIM